MERLRILLTGATGRIGTAFRAYIGDRYQLRLAAHHLDKLTDAGAHEAIELEIADPEACQRACAGMDIVVHLAAIATGRVPFYEGLLDSNIKGIYNILRAAKDQGCRRVIFASSVQAVDGHPLDVQAKTDEAVCPSSIYGATKCFGEALANYFAHKEGLSCIAIRIGSFQHEWMKTRPVNSHMLSKFISQRDMCQLLVRCIETPDIAFAIVHGVSDNRFKRLDLTSTKKLLGYEPEDDSFALWDIKLPPDQ
jgi:nucleoside-diphosphate-sugar epimerase